MNRYPLWKYILIIIIVIIGTIYALPNIYGTDPAVQITPARGGEVSELTELQAQVGLDTINLKPTSTSILENSLLLRFNNEEDQLKAQEALKKSMGKDFVVALNLAPSTPEWLRKLGAEPMFLGLDLRGGVHFLMEVDMDAAIAKSEERYVSDLRSLFRENKVRYKSISRQDRGGVLVRYVDASQQQEGDKIIERNLGDIRLDSTTDNDQYQSVIRQTDTAIKETRKNALQQNITTLRKRVNELGVAEPVIQQQGTERVVVELPGVQDTARAKDILGATATLEFRLVDTDHPVQDAVNGRVPAGSRLYYDRSGQPVLLQKQVMLTGDYIIDAASGIDSQSGGPDVSITLDSKGAYIFSNETRDAVGKLLAVVFIETKSETVEENGQMVKHKQVTEEVINSAVIREQLGKRFHITGLDSTQEARNLALLLRAGALAAPIEIVEERTVGPSLGQENIKQGYESILIGFIAVLIFMMLYYRLFGLIANIALTLNVILIFAMMSMLQATLTMPGIAGIVLTVGMAVDANVLIFERIREEIRNGNSPQASIYAGFEKAFSSIADGNITTLIAALVLFSFGTGPIKGFAVTLSLGIISSMFTAITVSRAIINLIYGGRKVSRLMI